ncbi:MAG TPA: type III restriction endonuclease subunit R [Alphaproteobacteria bacterium]|nr:type III restriction endonuclease subunit R [Alphaproteobacteria bacterium]
MDKHLNSISNRLSLRTPQRDSLELLSRVADIIPLNKERDVAKALEIIKSEFPTVEDFEREFPSLCFALATGVGKTRLMGAFIAYLHLSKGIRHFFVLAPNLTIYNKLIADFTPNTPKYVFQGISEFALNPPLLITGDTYERVRNVSNDLFGDVSINIFNISKINSEVRGGKAPRIKRLSEYLGESYFEYLSKLDDLVILMDESHRYRASAGIKAINELNPVLGLELTATPQIEAGSKQIPFKNVIFSYPLFRAMEDGFVKEPAVATRENFDAKNYSEDQLERLKLEDGIRIHETVKTELKVYSDNNDKSYVKPFMMVIAKDTTHAGAIEAFIKSDEFFQGRYKDRVITVHSSQTGEEKDENVQRLLSVEDPKEPTEIVIHVNMLKEGWDVTNLYTIVPLRTANSRTLVEQSIGRGLRLPYGKRTGVKAVDRLTIVAHDKFDEIIQEANRKDSIVFTGIVIGKDISLTPKKAIEIRSNLDAIIGNNVIADMPEELFEAAAGGQKAKPVVQELKFNEEEKKVAKATMEIIKSFERLPTSKSLMEKSVQFQIVQQVQEKVAPVQAEMDVVKDKVDVEETVRKTIEAFIQNTIDIPRIIITPVGTKSYSFDSFKLDTSGIGRYNPVDQQILIQHLRTAEREQLQSDRITFEEDRLEDYIVAALIDFDDISYDDHADILYELSSQIVAYIKSYLTDEQDILNVLQFYRKEMARVIHAQMQAHYRRGATEFKATVSKGFERPKISSVSYDSSEKLRYFRNTVDDRNLIRGMLFQGFSKCLYPIQKFHSDTERLFAVLLEDEPSVIKWFKPAREDFKIFYSGDSTYEPDFVVETSKEKLICEPKRDIDIGSEEVKEKAEAAIKWCEAATNHELEHGGKPWCYVLIPHTEIKPSASLSGLVNRFYKK